MQLQESKSETDQLSQISPQHSQKNTTKKKVQESPGSSVKKPGPIQTKQGNKPPIQSKQSAKPPIQTKEGRKGLIQAKQRPVPRNQKKSDTSGKASEAQIKANVSAITGTDVNNANVHYHSDKPAQLKATAYAQGNDIYMSSGVGDDNHTLAHELTHNAQQQTDQVKATMQANNGVGINNDPKLEKHADEVATKAIDMPPAQMKTTTSTPSFLGNHNAPVQGMFYNKSGAQFPKGKLESVITEFMRSSQYNELVAKYTEERVVKTIEILKNLDIHECNLSNPDKNYLNEENYTTIASTISNVIDNTPKTDKNYQDLADKTFKELLDLTKTQADWHTQELSDESRNSIRSALSFIREPNIETTLGSFKVDEFLKLSKATGSKEELLNSLRKYAQVKVSDKPLEIDQPTTLQEVQTTGERLLAIQDAVPRWMINGNLKKETFQHFDISQITELKNYYDKSADKPYFQSNEDFRGFLSLSKDKGKNPVDYNGTSIQGKIRNYHRFQKEALDQLVVNFGDTSKTKPLTLIVHTALDHNGAFVQEAKLTALIQNNNLLTLMLEGKESLGAYTSEIDKMTSDYGKNGKIDQVMIAGHGSATTVQMGGKIEEEDGKVQEVSDGIDIKDNLKSTKALFDKLLDNMNKTDDKVKEPHRRILFSSCLANSVNFRPDNNEETTWDEWFLNEEGDSVRAQMQAWLTKNKNLVSYMALRAEDKDIDLDKVVGSMASLEEADLFDSTTNKLDLLNTGDDYQTADDKKDYVTHGHDPTGVFNALAFCWTNSDSTYRQEVFKEVEKRAGSGNASWPDAIIEAVYSWLKAMPAYWRSFHFINGLVFMAAPLSRAEHADEGDAESLRVGIQHAFTLSNYQINGIVLQVLYEELKKAPTWSAKTHLPFVFYQAYVGVGQDGYISQLLKYIDDNYPTVAAIRQHLSIKTLQTEYGDLSSVISWFENNPASLKIALASVIYGPEDESAKAYLKKNIKDGKFTADSKVADLLVGSSTENEVLIKLGVKAAPESETSNTSASTPDTPNVTLVGGSKVFVEPVTLKGKITADNTSAYQNSHDSSTKLADLAKDEQVYILGSSGTFWAIEHVHENKQTTAFVKKDVVNIISKTSTRS